MARPPTLSFDRGTLLLHPPPPGKAWIDYATWDDRVERFRIPALHYRRLVEALKRGGHAAGGQGARVRSTPPGTGT